MSERENEPLLPRVTNDDIIEVDIRKLLDPKDVEAFDLLKKENPRLAQEIIRRAYHASAIDTDGISSVELLAKLMESAVFPVEALRMAMARQRQEKDYLRSEKEAAALPSGDVGDADPQPSA